MTFDDLLALVSSKHPPSIRLDSRLVKDGDVFVAVEGSTCDGHDFINQALANGAKYVVCQQDGRWTTKGKAQSVGDGQKNRASDDVGQSNHEIIIVDDSSQAAALLAQASCGHPALQLTSVAVTGTNGKTTVAYLVRSCMETAGEKCGLIGTITYDTGSAGSPATLTTPDCLALAEMQKQMVGAGTKYMVIEASSHALSQNRLAGVQFRAAAFTNLAGDHLDYHKTKEDYLAAKTKLFSALSPDATAVLNKQSPEAKHIAESTQARILWYAVGEPADIRADIESMDINGTVFTLDCHRVNSKLRTQDSKLIVRTPLLGRYNVSNHLAAAGLCLAAGLDLETVAAGLSALRAIPGRLEKVEWQGDFSVIIDYAHTDDALKHVLATLKPLCKGRLIVVFGCGGDRDRTKRPRMARVAEQLADIVIVTSDNPRTEKPEAIIDEILAGFERTTHHALRTTITVESDRKKAIELGLETAGKDDIVLIAGKGHETYQIVGDQKLDFSDKETAQEHLEKLR